MFPLQPLMEGFKKVLLERASQPDSPAPSEPVAEVAAVREQSMLPGFVSESTQVRLSYALGLKRVPKNGKWRKTSPLKA